MLVLPRFDGHLMIVPSGAKGVRQFTRSRRKFTAEFRAEAVEMVESADGNIAHVAKELGSMTRRWGSPHDLQRPRQRAAQMNPSWPKVYGKGRKSEVPITWA